MTTHEAAHILGITSRAITSLIRKERIHATKRGRDYWIEPEEVARYASERRAVGRPKKVA